MEHRVAAWGLAAITIRELAAITSGPGYLMHRLPTTTLERAVVWFKFCKADQYHNWDFDNASR
jgi:hypothetical protein